MNAENPEQPHPDLLLRSSHITGVIITIATIHHSFILSFQR